MEKYSILMSVYKNVKIIDLKNSIESMLHQTAKPEQFVIVQDGPVGNDLNDLISTYEENYSEIFTIIKLDENKGLAYALNVGMNACRNNLIARMDSDDYSLPKRCEKQLECFSKNKSLALVGTATQHFKSNPFDPEDSYFYSPADMQLIKKKIRRNSAFSHPTVMYKKDAVLSCGGYDPNLRRSQDHDLFSKMISYGFEAMNLEEALVLYRTDSNGIGRHRNSDSLKARLIIQKRILDRGDCSFFDYLYVCLGVYVMKWLPKKLYEYIYLHLKEDKRRA